MNCTECGQIVRYDRSRGQSTTLVGYYSADGHDHDDNCIVREYVCQNGHRAKLSIINKCSTPGCGWSGKASCFCSYKIEAWPEENAQ